MKGLKKLRKARGMTQDEAAEALGKHTVWLARRERGETDVKVAELLAIAALYGMSDAQILELVREWHEAQGADKE